MPEFAFDLKLKGALHVNAESFEAAVALLKERLGRGGRQSRRVAERRPNSRRGLSRRGPDPA